MGSLDLCCAADAEISSNQAIFSFLAQVLMTSASCHRAKELFPLRIENLDWNNRTIFVPDSKTPNGRRYIPMSDRVVDLLLVRCAGRREGWVFPASSASGHITTIDKQFRKASADADLPEGLKLYCGRHDFGTEMLQRTGNLALVMRVMGQTSTKGSNAIPTPRPGTHQDGAECGARKV